MARLRPACGVLDLAREKNYTQAYISQPMYNLLARGLEQEFLDHGTRNEILDAAGLSPQHLSRRLTEAVARRTPEATPAQAQSAEARAATDAPANDSSTQDRFSE